MYKKQVRPIANSWICSFQVVSFINHKKDIINHINQAHT